MDLTLTVPDSLGRRLKRLHDELPAIIELGLRELDETDPGFAGMSDVIEPTPSYPKIRSPGSSPAGLSGATE
jgi:hypothetical protein